jgi:hypothetical protein
MVQAVAQAFDVRQFPVLRWAYRVPPEVRVNFFLTVGREEYELIFTNPDHPSPTARPLGRIPSVVADGEWHEAAFNLRTLLAGNGADSATISDFGFRISDFGRGSGFRNSQFAIRNSQFDTASVPYRL